MLTLRFACAWLVAGSALIRSQCLAWRYRLSPHMDSGIVPNAENGPLRGDPFPATKYARAG